jgi:hypothetical protein
MEGIYPRLKQLASYDLVKGIPFNEEKDQLLKYCNPLMKYWNPGLDAAAYSMCRGSFGEPTLELIGQLKLKHPHLEFVLPAEISGRGSAIRLCWNKQTAGSRPAYFRAKMATRKGRY